MIEKASIFVFASPSGGGKTSLVKALLEKLDNIEVSISHSTRARRKGEQEAKHYYFVDDDEFGRLVKANTFIEHANVFGYQYGTNRQQIERRLSLGIDVLLDIDWQGARQLRQHFTNVVSIFILPPSVDSLKQRLQHRQQDNIQTIQDRMEKAQHELRHYDEFDYLVVNDDFETALSDIVNIIKADRLRNKFQSFKHQTLLANLLNNES